MVKIDNTPRFIWKKIVNTILKDKYPNFEVGLKCILMVNP